jgi:L-aminopeptidase/D-esterase-like protein
MLKYQYIGALHDGAIHYGMLKLAVCCLLAVLLSANLAMTQTDSSKPVRARDLGVPFDGTTGAFNAITDVPGVEVGATTLIRGDGPLKVGEGPVRTGVTAVLPRGKNDTHPTYAGWFSLNGNGEMTGTAWVEESGLLEGPIGITNTHSVGVVRDTIIQWALRNKFVKEDEWSLPVVAETWDGYLNDLNGFHVKPEHVFSALDSARSGPVAEGNTGGGTGMICYGFKGGTGTSSRVIAKEVGGYTVGVVVQCNCGQRRLLTIAGVPVGKEIPMGAEEAANNPPGSDARGDVGSIIIVVGTNAPLLPHQLKRIARRASMGLARTGSISGNGSGDIFIAFSTANPNADDAPGPNKVETVPNEKISALFEATVQATEEAIVNAMVAAKTMTGVDGHTVPALPHDELQRVMKKYQR